MSKVVALTGSVASGKTTIALTLAERFGVEVVPTRSLLIAYASTHGVEVALERQSLQQYGKIVDEATNSSWFVEEVDRVARSADAQVILIDAVRLPRQLAVLKRRWGRQFLHAHVDVPREERERRYAARSDQIDQMPYVSAIELDSDEAVTLLGQHAEIRLRGGALSSIDLAMFCGGRLGLELL